MLKNLINQSSRCLNKLNLLPKQTTLINLKHQTTITNYHEIEGYKSIFMNYSTGVSYPKDYVKKIIDIQRNQKISPYIFFVKDQLKSNDQNGVSQTKKFKDFGEKWNSMSEIEKKPYIDQAAKNRQELAEEKNKLLSSLNEEAIRDLNNDINNKILQRSNQLKEIRLKKEKNKQNAPKRPKGAFFLYCETLDRGEAHIKDFVRGAAAKWNLLAEQDKQKFFDQANELMEQYKRDYADWEGKMVEKGKKKLLRKKTLEAIDATSLKKPKKLAKNKTKDAKDQVGKKSGITEQTAEVVSK